MKKFLREHVIVKPQSAAGQIVKFYSEFTLKLK